MHISSVVLSIVSTIGSAMLAGCEPGAPPAGSYFLPQAVIGVRLDTDAQAHSMRSLLNEFARQHGLHKYRASDDPLRPLSVREDSEHARMTEYNPPIDRDTHGFDFVLVEISSRCWVIQLHDRTGNWTPESIRSFYELHRALNEASPRNAFVFARPTPEQNWESRQQLGTAVDPQQPKAIEELCLRMGVHEARDRSRK